MAASLNMRWADISGLRKMEKALDALGPKKVAVIAARSLNHSGAKGKTRARRELTAQTGLPNKTINAAMRVTRASAATLEFRIRAIGGDVALKHFAARETRRGVSAKPFNQRQIFKGTFIKGGRWPHRVAIGRGGQVFERTGSGRTPIEKVKSGVIIPREMVQGETAKAWQDTLARSLPTRFAHDISRATGQVFK